MSNISTFGTVLKTFQTNAVSNGTAIFKLCLTELAKVRHTANYSANKKLIVADVGAILFEAPTGTGKTLMAGHVAENISQLHNTTNLPKVLWFWIAPFAGLIDQAEKTIRTEFVTLRPKDLATGRALGDLKSGDIFVTTWQSVAVANESSRKARVNTETMPSIDVFVEYARAQGFAIGVIIDEAHHTFRGQNQAFAFYKDILSPELTILATATPRDKDIDTFIKVSGITNLRRITVSREDAIDERLIKEGIKAAIFKAPSDVESFINFKKTALKQGVATHNRLKQLLTDIGSSVTPLLLVQVDSSDGSVDEATQWLKELGFRAEGQDKLIRSHTADEPDPYLSTIAADESVEVLIFKLAVATGFDAPRAFTLVSFRPSRDEDFGVQIVGRILRVDRRLQTLTNLPTVLNHGYVFLSDNASQTGLTSAAQRINAVKTELASVTSNIAVVSVGDNEPAAQITKHGQTSFLNTQGDIESSQTQNEINTDSDHEEESVVTIQSPSLQDALFESWDLTPSPSSIEGDTRKSNVTNEDYHVYKLNTDFGAPMSFRKAILSLESANIVSDIVGRFRFDDDVLLVAQQGATKILMEGQEIFGNRKDRPEEIRADLAQNVIDARAQLTLFNSDENDMVDFRALHEALSKQLRKELENKGIDHLFDTDQKIRDGLHKILALRPIQLKRAISEATTIHTKTEEAQPIPLQVVSKEPLDPSRLNLYGIYPADLNMWERPYAEYLDSTLDTVLWWHRNQPLKPWAVCMPLPGQPKFYPDFIVGIKDRKHGKGILLMETKRDINDQAGNAKIKAQAEHPDYGDVLMIYWEDKRVWRVVEYDPKTDKNFLDRALRPELFASY